MDGNVREKGVKSSEITRGGSTWRNNEPREREQMFTEICTTKVEEDG
jgi:hypothetical protein